MMMCRPGCVSALALWLLISSPPVPGEEGLPVAFITDLLAALGEHLPLLLVGCAEILLAVYLIGKLLWGKIQRKSSGKGGGPAYGKKNTKKKGNGRGGHR